MTVPPAEFHSQTAIEAAKKINASLQKQGKTAEDIKFIVIRTHEACIRIIDKQHKPMDNFADRDHCIQYMVATMLVFNRLHATDYTDGSEAATSELVERIRTTTSCKHLPELIPSVAKRPGSSSFSWTALCCAAVSRGSI